MSRVLHGAYVTLALTLALPLFGMRATSAEVPSTIPSTSPVFSEPMAVIDGVGIVRFRVTFGLLVGAGGQPVGLYRSYPSQSSTPLSELYGLGMLETRAGVILSSLGDVPLLVLHGHLKPGIAINTLTLSYLASAAPRRYAQCAVNIKSLPGGRWELVDGAGRRIRKFTVVSARRGIRALTPCPSPVTQVPN